MMHVQPGMGIRVSLAQTALIIQMGLYQIKVHIFGHYLKKNRLIRFI